MSLTGYERQRLRYCAELVESGSLLWPYERDALIGSSASSSTREGLIVDGWPCEDARTIVKLLLERAGYTGEATGVSPANTPEGRGVLIEGVEFKLRTNDPRDRGWTHLTITAASEGFRLGGVDLVQGADGFEVAEPAEVSK